MVIFLPCWRIDEWNKARDRVSFLWKWMHEGTLQWSINWKGQELRCWKHLKWYHNIHLQSWNLVVNVLSYFAPGTLIPHKGTLLFQFNGFSDSPQYYLHNSRLALILSLASKSCPSKWTISMEMSVIPFLWLNKDNVLQLNVFLCFQWNWSPGVVCIADGPRVFGLTLGSTPQKKT